MPTNAPNFQLLAPTFTALPCVGVGEETSPVCVLVEVGAAVDVAEPVLLSCNKHVMTKANIKNMANAELTAVALELVSSITPLTM